MRMRLKFVDEGYGEIPGWYLVCLWMVWYDCSISVWWLILGDSLNEIFEA